MSWIVERLCALWDGALSWEPDSGPHPPEVGHLALDSSAAERGLGWEPVWDLPETLRRVVEWHEGERKGKDLRRVSLGQIEQFALDWRG